MDNRIVAQSLMFFSPSLIGGTAGALAASLITFWLYPQLQSDVWMFLTSLFSIGSVESAVFVWLFYLPGIIALILFNKRFVVTDDRDARSTFFMTVSFLLVFISQLHPFAAFVSGAPEYLLNVALSGLILTGTMALSRKGPNL